MRNSMRLRARLRLYGLRPTVWRRRAAFLGGAILIGLVALTFARLADEANHVFLSVVARWWWARLLPFSWESPPS